MSSKRDNKFDKRLQDGWQLQRKRVDAWEIKPFPDVEWLEVRAFIAKTASTFSKVIGTRAPVERELIELLGSYLTGEVTRQSDASPVDGPDQAWADLLQAPLKGPFIQAVNRLHAYAAMGTLLDHDLPAKPEQFVMQVDTDLQMLAALLSQLPKVAPAALQRSSGLTLQMLHDVAQARLSVDEGMKNAPASGLAWLGRVSVKTVQNMLSRGSLDPGGPGAADARSARAWLNGRSEWTRSCWREAIEVISAGFAAPFREFESDGVPVEASEQNDQAVEWVFVPRSSDGSLFTPDLMRQRGWTVGPRGAERSFGDYWRALQMLQEDKRPCWRRPSETGAFNTVIGKDWVRISRSELELQLKSALAGGART